MKVTKKKEGMKIIIEPEDIPSNPKNVSQMSEVELVEEHKRRKKNDPGYQPGFPPKTWVYHDQIDYMDELEALWGKKWGAQGLGKLKEVVMCPPSENEVRDIFWEDQEASACQWILGKPDLKRWIEQYEGLVKVYRDNGIIVHEYEVPNVVMGPYGFTRWLWAATTTSVVINGGAIMTRPGYFGSEVGRNPIYQRVLAELGCPIIYAVRGKGVAELDGCVWLDGHHLVVEEGTIMNHEGIQQLKPVLAASGAKMIVMHVTGHYQYMAFPAGGTSHPDMVVGFPAIGLAVVAPYMCGYNFIKFLKRIKYDIIEVPPDEYLYCPYNMVVLEPGKVVCPAGGKKTIKAMEDWGIKVIAIPYDECIKAGGAINCSTGKLIREPGPLCEELQKTPLEELAPDLAA